MKRNLLYLTIITFIFLIFQNYNLVLSSTIDAVNIWLYKVFPYLFIMIIINDLLINLDFSRNFKSNITYIFIMSILSGTPTSAYITSNLYQEKKISQNNANLSLLFTYFCNPLFLYSILNSIFNSLSFTIKIMSIHYLSNIIILLLVRKKLIKELTTPQAIKIDLTGAIKRSITTLTMILGTICFYMVTSEIILNTFNINETFNTIFKGILEITQGLNSLINLNINLPTKELMVVCFTSFGGFSIHTQIKCILEESKLEYKYFFLGRILEVVIALILLTIYNIVI